MAVVTGEVIAGPLIRAACRRHLDDLVHGPDRGLWWDVDAAMATWSWWEGTLKLSEGQFEGIPFKLHASQAFRVGLVFGWKKWREPEAAPHGWYRRFRRLYDEEGKGNGKSPLAGGIGLKMMVADGEAGAQIYATAAKKDQAKILFADAVKMVRKSPALRKRLKFSGGEGNEYNIAHHKSGSFFRPISKDSGKKGSGPRPHCALADEVHELPDGKSVEMLERGFKSRMQPFLAMFTNSGSDLKSYCYQERKFAAQVALGTRTPDDEMTYVGEVIDDEMLSFICCLDKGDDPFTDRSCWFKSNPLLGVILEQSYLEGVIRQAQDMPGKRNGILRLHFCVWTDAEEGWMGREVLDAALADFDPYVEHAGKKLFTGTDLSGTRDLTAAAHAVETGTKTVACADGSTTELPTYDVWVESWTPAEGLAVRAAADEAPYEQWVHEGHLRTTPGPRVRMDVVAKHFAEIDAIFDIQAAAYDRYAYHAFQAELDAFGLEFLQLEHPQGGKKRAPAHESQIKAAKDADLPPPEGLWMPGSLNKLEELFLEGCIRIRNNPVVVSAIMSAAIEKDAFDNRWFSKRKATQRIDPLVSIAMAIGAATQRAPKPKPSVYESRGIRRL